MTATSITCPQCGKTSPHATDIAEGYCNRCHAWTSEPGGSGVAIVPFPAPASSFALVRRLMLFSRADATQVQLTLRRIGDLTGLDGWAAAGALRHALAHADSPYGELAERTILWAGAYLSALQREHQMITRLFMTAEAGVPGSEMVLRSYSG
jgi:hypothetical protein